MEVLLSLLEGILQSEALFGLLMIVIASAAVWAVKSYNDWKIKSGNKEDIESIEKIVGMAVKFVEQVFKEEDNKVKLEEAKKAAKDSLDSRGIKIGGRELSEFIEAAVYTAKNEVQKQVNVTEEPLEVEVVETPESLKEVQADFDSAKLEVEEALASIEGEEQGKLF